MQVNPDHDVPFGIGHTEGHVEWFEFVDPALGPLHRVGKGLLIALGCPGRRDTRIVDQDIESPVMGHHAIDRGIERRRVGHVEHRGLAADLGRDSAGRDFVAVADHHVRTVSRQAPGELGSQSRTTPGDDDDHSAQITGPHALNHRADRARLGTVDP